MEHTRKDAKSNPAATANVLSKLVFWWLNPLFSIGYRRTLEEDDLYDVLPEEKSETLGNELQSLWDHEVQAAARDLRTPKLIKAIIKCHWKSYSVLGLITFIEEAVALIQPIFLGEIIRYFENYKPDNKNDLYAALGYGAGLSACTILLATFHHIYFFHCQRAGMRIRVALCHMIYRKALRLSSTGMGKTTTGQIVNLLSNDVQKFDEVTLFLHFLWVGPLQAAVVVGLLWREIGPSCFAGVAVLMILMPIQSMFGKLFSNFRSKTAVLTDARIRTMNEVVSGIRIIKMYAWEKPFAALVSEVRRKEISKIMMSSYLRGLNMSSSLTSSKIIIFVTFTLYVLLGNPISAKRVFVTVSLYSSVQLTVNLFFPLAIEKLFESRVSIRRIKQFLLLDEITKNHVLLQEDEKDVSVEIQDLTCFWNKNLDAPTLQNISLTVNSPQLVAVIGPVGAGKDLELLPEGDLTVIGDRGATLSGGQKARVNLARAVYQDADIYLLDDPLSAVDAEVGRHLFQKCICGLLKNKPRIVVTHQLHYLKAVDQIVVLKEGRMVAKGTYTELQHSGVDFVSLLKKDEDHEQQQPPQEILLRTRTLSQRSVVSQTSLTECRDGDLLPGETVQTMMEENRAEGSIGVGLYIKYLRAGAPIVILLGVLLLNFAAEVANIMQDWWLSHWANEQEMLAKNSTVIQDGQNVTQELDRDFYLGVYGGVSAAIIVFGYLRNLFLFNVLVRSAQSLHNRMFNAVLCTPVQFFDVNPIGRVLNRFSKDIGQLDSNLPWTFVDFLQVFLQVLGVIAVAASVIPWILIPVIPLLIIFLVLRRYFLKTSRDVKRLEATTRSPVFSHLSSSLQGMWTIRAFGEEERFQKIFDAHQDMHSAAWFLFLATSRWLGLRLDGLCAIFVTIATFCCLLLRDQLNAGSVGLALSYSITLMGMFQWGVQQSAEMENMMTSVERVLEYAELESEAPWETEKRPPPEWPSKGLITFDRVNFSYSADGPVVLHNLTAVFHPKEKVGIVGRTGAGKSSLISALFRLAEPQGKIFIDGVLTSDIGLHDLRKNMSIIPQDPVLFTGSMRKNLDPFNEHTDEELWNALQEVQLKPSVEELPGKLETVLAESGSNFSAGQRQLVCLARAILRKNRILVIDEATANVDHRTDDLIQQTIREKFRECTVLTIAHRLNTVIDSDRILILDAGKIHAYDEPYSLLQNPSGILYKMVQQTGKQEAATLLEAAKQVYESRSRPIIVNGHVDTIEDNLIIFETAL